MPKLISPIERSIKALKQGKIIIIIDDEGRENEGDFVFAAEKVTPEKVNFITRYGRGLVFVPMTQERVEELDLKLMIPTEENTEYTKCAFTVSVDAKKGTTTGISVQDRAKTIKALADPKTRPYDLARPGHIFPLRAHPGGVVYRLGHTEAIVDLMKLAGLKPVGVGCEILDDNGKPARAAALKRIAKRHKMPVVTVEEIIQYRRERDSIVKRVASAKLPTEYGTFSMYVYKSLVSRIEHVALVKGVIRKDRPTLLRVHSQCLTGDTLHSLRCDCRPQLSKAMEMISREGAGAIVYLNQEGRGIGLTNKIRAYNFQEEGHDTVIANKKLGLPADMRDYNVGSQIVVDLGIRKIKLLTNNPDKITGIQQYGLEVIERIPLETKPQRYNRKYLKTKRDRLGHMITKLERRG